MRERSVPHVVEESGYPQLLDVVVVETCLAGDGLADEACHVHRPDHMLEPAVNAARIDQGCPRKWVDPSKAFDEDRVDKLSLFLGDFDVAVNRVSDFCDILQGHASVPRSRA